MTKAITNIARAATSNPAAGDGGNNHNGHTALPVLGKCAPSSVWESADWDCDRTY